MEQRSWLEERMAKVKGILEEVRARLNHLETKVSQVRQEVNRLRDRIDTQFRWLVALMVAIWITVILAILFTP